MNRKGFTLIELVMVLVLIGILAVFVAPRMGNITSTETGPFADKMRADLRYAQNLAMTRGLRTRVDFSIANQYTVQSSATSTCTAFPPATDPATGGQYTVIANSGIYAGITFAASMTCLEYDSLGQPYSCMVGVCSTNPSGMTITINPGGSIIVSAQTGAVN